MPYIGSRPDNVISRNAQNEYNYTATGGQTVFTGADTNNNILSYTPGNIEVYFNGARLEESDFTATNGTSVVLANAAVASDELSIVAVNVFEVADVVPASTGGTFQSAITVQGGVTVGGHILPDTNITYDLGSNTQRFRDLYLSGTTIQLGSKTLNQDNIPEVNLSIAPEVLEIQIDAPGAGQNPPWLWTWEQSTLPYARRTITNSPEVSVPLYKQGTYTVNNFAKTIHGSMTQTHTLYFKWVDGAGTDNLISWVTDQGTVTDSHPDINGGNSQTVQRLSISVPSTITVPTLTAPTGVTYGVTNNGAGAYTFSDDAHGDNPNIGPLYRGGTYTFNVNAVGHPFYLTTDNGTNWTQGGYFGEYTSGVTNSRTDNGTVTFVVPANAPDTLYYQCGNHSAMRGAITVKDLAVETNNNGNYIVYAQHDQEGHKTPIELRPIPSLVNQMCLVYDASVNKFVPQDLATYVENTPSFENKIREVAGTAELVVEDGSAVVAKVNVYADSTYLPLVGNNAGDQAFATDINKLYIWDGSAWQQAGSATTDELAEGSTNLYYTDARVSSYLSANDFDTATNIVASITDSAPATLDTLNELAAALGDDPNFATTTANNIATKVSKSGDTMSGALTVGNTGGGANRGVGIDPNGEITQNATDGSWLHLNRHIDGLVAVGHNSNANLYVANNVGIGTDNPSHQIHSYKNGVNIDNILKVENDQINYGAVFIADANSNYANYQSISPTASWIFGQRGLGSGKFEITDSTSGLARRFVIDSTGNVGIGTSSPDTILHISSAGSPQIRVQDTTNDVRGQFTANDSNVVIGTVSNHSLNFATNNGNQVTLAGSNLYPTNNNTNQLGLSNRVWNKIWTTDLVVNGNVGIGTSSPDLKLHVDGSNGYPATSGSTPIGHMAIRAKNESSSHGAHIGVADASPWGTWIQAQDANNLATSYPLLLNPNGGNVGIGNTSPSWKLDVTGEIASRASSPGLYLYDANVSNLQHRIIGGGNAGIEYAADMNDVGAGYHRWDIGPNTRMTLNESGELSVEDGVVKAPTEAQSTPVDGDGWYTIATLNGGRKQGTIELYEYGSSRHNYVKIEVVWSYGQGSISVVNAGRHSLITFTKARLMYDTTNQTYATGLLQVYFSGVITSVSTKLSYTKRTNWLPPTLVTSLARNDAPTNYATLKELNPLCGGSGAHQWVGFGTSDVIRAQNQPSWNLRPNSSGNVTMGATNEIIGWSASTNGSNGTMCHLTNVSLSASSSGTMNANSSGRINIQYTGTYKVWCTIRCENTPGTGNIYLKVNGSTVARQHVEVWGRYNYAHGFHSHVMKLNQGDYIEWMVSRNGGVVSGYNDTVNWAGGIMIG